MAPSTWTGFTLDGVPETRFSIASGGEIRIEAEKSFGLRYAPIPPGAAPKRFLTWRWRIENLEEGPRRPTAEHDDRPLAIHLWFPETPGRSSFRHTIRRSVAGLLGKPLPGNALTYSWGGVGPKGRYSPNPAIPEEGRVMILHSVDDGLRTWRTEKIAVATEFERAFGFRGPAPSHIAVSADMEDTQGKSVAFISDIAFVDE